MRRSWIRDNYEIVATGFMLTIFIGVIIIALVFGIKNECSRITEGTVIDKDYSSEYVQVTYHKSGDVQIPQIIHHPESYRMKIEGQKGEETVTYWFECTADEYQRYSVGDYYRK